MNIIDSEICEFCGEPETIIRALFNAKEPKDCGEK